MSCPDYKGLSKAAANHIFSRIRQYPVIHLGLAAGRSPELTYKHIASYLKEDPDYTHRIRITQIDEWLGISRTDAASCRSFLDKHVIVLWGLLPEQCYLLDGKSTVPDLGMSAMQDHLTTNPMDLCILGFGSNGHLALNEPGSRSTDPCRRVTLHPSSRNHPMILSSEIAINSGITIGLKEIMESREIILLVSGKNKKEAFDRFLTKDTVAHCPATVLYAHDNWRCIIDESALN